jgi:hypothetical protein
MWNTARDETASNQATVVEALCRRSAAAPDLGGSYEGTGGDWNTVAEEDETTIEANREGDEAATVENGGGTVVTDEVDGGQQTPEAEGMTLLQVPVIGQRFLMCLTVLFLRKCRMGWRG